MNTPRAKRVPSRKMVLTVILLTVLLMTLRGIAGYVIPSAETSVLKKSAVKCLGGEWHKRFAIHLGWFTTSAVRIGSRLFNIPAEPRALLDSIHAGDIGIYRLDRTPTAEDVSRLFHETDSEMKNHGWERVVTVVEHGELVAVYMARHTFFFSSPGCAVMVLKERDFVVCSAKGSLRPLMELAAHKKGLLPSNTGATGEGLLKSLGDRIGLN
jgi:hypothetical protein